MECLAWVVRHKKVATQSHECPLFVPPTPAIQSDPLWAAQDFGTQDVLPKLDPSDFRVKLTLKALYSTYRDLQQLGLDEEARLLTEQHRDA